MQGRAIYCSFRMLIGRLYFMLYLGVVRDVFFSVEFTFSKTEIHTVSNGGDVDYIFGKIAGFRVL